MKITSHKWLTCFFRRGREGRVTEYFLIHNLFVLPLFLSQSYFNCRQRPQRNIIFYDKTLLYIKKMDQTLSCKNVLFHGICGYYLKKKKKNLSSDTIQTSNLKKSHWADFASELKHDGTHPTLWWLRVKASIQAEPSSGNQQTNMCRHDSAVDLDCRIWKQRLNSTSSLMNKMVYQIPWKQKICTQWDNSFEALKGRGGESTVIILIKWAQEEYTSLWSRMWHTSSHPL